MIEQPQPDTVIYQQDPLQLDLNELTMIAVINERIKSSKGYYEKNGYPDRRRRNKNFYLGNQWEKPRKEYESDYVDNLIYESEGTIKPIALSRLPDLLIKPGNDTEESRELAESMTDVINSDIRKRENRKVLGLAFKHVPIFFQGVVKCVWDPREGRDGDYKFIVVHPENIVVDHTATTNDVDDMDFIAEFRDISVKEAVMMFPSKEEELVSRVAMTRGTDIDTMKLESNMASKIRITEVWFDWYKQTTDPATGTKKWETISAVVWKYDDMILGKMKNPYWDWQGEKQLFTMKMGEKKEASLENIIGSIQGFEELEQETYFRNYFSNPRKPYIFLNYDQMGECPLDATSRIEQSIPLQKDVNKRGAQISEMNDRARGKLIFSSRAIDKETVESMDLSNPDEDIMVDAKDIRTAYAFLQPPPAPAPLYTEQEQERQKAFSKMGTNATTRGVREGNETATARQLFKESDYGRIDDIVEETVNAAAEQMAQWAMQMIKLYYTKGKMRKLLGKDGDVSFQMITQDTVEDGQEVVISASGVDKMQTKREAIEMANMQLIDPLTFFIDMGASDPKGRAKKLLTFLSAPELYMQEYVEDRDTQGMADALRELPAGGEQAQAMSPEQAMPQQPQMAMGGGGPRMSPDVWGMMMSGMRSRNML